MRARTCAPQTESVSHEIAQGGIIRKQQRLDVCDSTQHLPARGVVASHTAPHCFFRVVGLHRMNVAGGGTCADRPWRSPTLLHNRQARQDDADASEAMRSEHGPAGVRASAHAHARASEDALLSADPTSPPPPHHSSTPRRPRRAPRLALARGGHQRVGLGDDADAEALPRSGGGDGRLWSGKQPRSRYAWRSGSSSAGGDAAQAQASCRPQMIDASTGHGVATRWPCRRMAVKSFGP